MPHLFRQRLFQRMLLPAFLTALASPVPARAPALHWEKIHVFHATATIVFARLGLTHSTKNGHTRDGKQGVADPDFPPGLTDVVPNDAEGVLLARGTDGGLSLFRTRVAAADVSIPPMHLKAQLSRREGIQETSVGMQEIDAVRDGLPDTLSLGDGETKRVYQITTRTNADGSFWIACRISLPLAAGPEASSAAAVPSAVFVPNEVWTDPLSRKVRLGETAIFEDVAAARQAASRRLGMTAPDTAGDYTLRVTLRPMATAPATTPRP